MDQYRRTVVYPHISQMIWLLYKSIHFSIGSKELWFPIHFHDHVVRNKHFQYHIARVFEIIMDFEKFDSPTFQTFSSFRVVLAYIL